MTEEQIITALECCGKGFGNCEGCPYDNDNNDCVTNDGKTLIFQDVLDLINRKNAEIERLQKENERFADIGKLYSEIRIEAIKEFAERLIDIAVGNWEHKVDVATIDNLVKEMVGGK